MCLYKPTCSEYTKRCINNLGVVRGILLGAWRILRCNPLSRSRARKIFQEKVVAVTFAAIKTRK